MLLTAISFSNCHEAINFYKEALGAEVKRINYAKDAPPEVSEHFPPNYVMYSEVTMFGATIVMTDGADKTNGGFWLQVMFDTPEEVTEIYNKLAEGGEVTDSLGPQFWAAMNASVKDRFGVEWNVLTNY